MRIIVSIDPDALPPGDGARLHAAAASLAELVQAGHELVVTHGVPAAAGTATGSPLVLALYDVLPGRTFAALVTHTEVGVHDPALRRPDPAGPPPSLRPHAVLEAPVVRELLADGTVVVCAAGGIPVIRERGTGALRTVPAVADPDLTAVLLAVQLDADALLFLTTATHLFAPRSRGAARPLLALSPVELAAAGLPEAVRPRAEAAAGFAARTGGLAAVGPVDNALGILHGTTGTLIRPAPSPAPAAH